MGDGAPSRDWRRQMAAGEVGSGAVFRFERTFSSEEIESFGRLIRDYNPVHYAPDWCAAKGLAGPVCHGMLVGSMICEPGGQLGWLADGMSFRFRRPVYPGDTITCELTLRELDERDRARAEAVFTNQHDQRVMTAELTGYLPVAAERELLATMLAKGDPTNPLSGE